VSDIRVLRREGAKTRGLVLGALGQERGRRLWRYARMLAVEQTRCSSDGVPAQTSRLQDRVGWVGVGPRREDGVLENQIGN
jgi:hypothetical protein